MAQVHVCSLRPPTLLFLTRVDVRFLFVQYEASDAEFPEDLAAPVEAKHWLQVRDGIGHSVFF